LIFNGEKMDNELHLSTELLQSHLDSIKQSPQDNGVLKAIVIRPVSNERVDMETSIVTPDGGVHGDRWAKQAWLALPAQELDPKAQITVMNSRAAEVIARNRERWPLAGDNFYVDLDLSEDNLQAGQQLSIGSAVFEVTPQPHNGCGKFEQRFGADALKWVNSGDGKHHHLRGIYIKVVKAGIINVNDTIKKV
jgi:MOSC domain-containing protein YiiM